MSEFTLLKSNKFTIILINNPYHKVGKARYGELSPLSACQKEKEELSIEIENLRHELELLKQGCNRPASLLDSLENAINNLQESTIEPLLTKVLKVKL